MCCAHLGLHAVLDHVQVEQAVLWPACSGAAAAQLVACIPLAPSPTCRVKIASARTQPAAPQPTARKVRRSSAPHASLCRRSH